MSTKSDVHTTAVMAEREHVRSGEACLFVVSGGTPGRHRIPADGSMVLGRAHDADLVITSPGVSRRHAVVHCAPQLSIEDLGSVNGTLVGGRRLEPHRRYELADGDVIQLAKAALVVQRAGEEPALLPAGELARLAEDACREGRPFVLAEIDLGAKRADEAVIATVMRSALAVTRSSADAYEVLLADDRLDDLERAIEQLRRSGLDVKAGTARFGKDGRDVETLRASARRRLAHADSVRPVVEDASMRSVRELARRVAASDLSILIVGETGVGKEVLADLVHRSSTRASGPYLCLNCAALSETLLESELFGHERGAFTGAVQSKPGLLEVARGGSVFLDEVGEMPLALQAKLLRVFESREIMRVGGLQPRPIDVRFIAATHRVLEDEIRAGRFRQDLYYRLDGITLEVPPLRERPREVVELARVFVDEAAARLQRRPVPAWSDAALAMLTAYRWPGNVRELRNVVERAVVLCVGDVIEPMHLPQTLGARGDTPSNEEDRLRSQLVELDRNRIARALEDAGGNQTHASRALGIARNTLIARMKLYGLEPKRR